MIETSRNVRRGSSSILQCRDCVDALIRLMAGCQPLDYRSILEWIERGVHMDRQSTTGGAVHLLTTLFEFEIDCYM